MKQKPKFEYKGEQFLTVMKTKLFFSTKKSEYDHIEVDVEYDIQKYKLKIKSIVVDKYTIPEFYTKDDVSNLIEFVRKGITNGKIELPMFISIQQNKNHFECELVDSVSQYVFV